MKRNLLVAIVVLLSAVTLSVSAQSADGLFLTGELGFGTTSADIVSETSIGAMLGYRFPGGLIVTGEYLFAGKDYFYPDDGEWVRVSAWSQVPDYGTSQSEYQFYRTRHVIGLMAGLSGTLGPVGVYGSGGFLFNTIDVPEAGEYYPEFEEAATTTIYGQATVVTTTALRAGIVYPAYGSVAGTFGIMMNFDRADGAGAGDYLQRNTLFILGVTFQEGGMR